jgi:predicted ribosomally synthesized peptide with SipW-like signal peptide
MKLSLHKKVLLSMGVVAGIGALAGAGTFATFTAQTSNPNTFADGTLVLSNKVGSNTACLSTGGGTTDTNANGSCDAALNLAVKAPGDSGTANLTLQNKGSLPASALKVFADAVCANGDAAAENYHGTGDPCTVVQFYIQKYSDSGFNNPSSCLYGGSPDSGTTCDFSDTGKTLGSFASSYAALGSGLPVGSLAAAGGADTTWIKVGVKLPATAGNSYQGRSAAVALDWHITQ